METVRLKNGTEEAEGLVVAIMLALNNLIDRNAIAFYEFVMKCRNPDHEFFGDCAEHMKGLLEANGSVHESIRNIVNSAVVGDELDMRIVNPVKGE